MNKKTEDIFVGTGTAEEIMTAFFADVERARQRDRFASQFLTFALLNLVRLHDRQARHGPVDHEPSRDVRCKDEGKK